MKTYIVRFAKKSDADPQAPAPFALVDAESKEAARAMAMKGGATVTSVRTYQGTHGSAAEALDAWVNQPAHLI